MLLLVLGASGAGGFVAYTRLTESGGNETTDADAPLTTSAIDTTAELGGSTTLPDTVYVRPTYRVASFVETLRYVGYEEGVPYDEEMIITAEVDYVTPVASFAFQQQGRRSLTQQVILTPEYTYKPPDTPDGWWERSPRQPSDVGMDTLEHLNMYQDVVTSDVRAAATDVTATDEVLHGVPVTTYRFTLPMTALPEVAALSDDGMMAALLKDELLNMQVTLSVDADGLLRVEEYQSDEQAWREYAAVATDGESMVTLTRVEVVATSDEPSTVVPPAVLVDAPTD